MTQDRETARRIAQAVRPLGGSVYYVGGCVRDRLLGRESKDLDIEVHGVTPQQLEAVLDQMGGRRTVGASFGVYGLAGCGLDIAMPRRETCRRLRRQLADAEARNQELEQRCAQLKVQADEYESLKDHVAQIEISAHRRTEQFREEAVTRLRQLAARQREWCRTAQADYEQMNCQLLERLQQAEQTLRQPDMSSFRRMEEGLTALEKGLTAPEKAGE